MFTFSFRSLIEHADILIMIDKEAQCACLAMQLHNET